ncbi:hypothetical protein Tco_0401307 [Tanacetum coccineum]
MFSLLLKSFDREDLETLWKLVKARHGETRPEERYERVLWGDLKIMFEPNIEDAVWRDLREGKVMIWKLFDSCGVHFVRFDNMQIYMLVDKKYPLTPATIAEMLNKKLQVDHWSEMQARSVHWDQQKTHKITIKKKKQSTPSIPVPRDDKERDAIAEATLLSLTLHKTALAAKAQENIAKVQEKLDQEEIDKMVDGDEDEESYASVFADSMFNDDVDDTGTKIEPGSHKEHPEHVSDDDKETEKEKTDEEVEKEKEVVEIEKEKSVDESIDKMDVVAKEKNVVDDVSGSQEIRKEQKQTPIPSPTISPKNVSSSDKIVSEELTATVSPTTTTTSKDPSTTKRKKRPFSHKTKTLPVLQHCNTVVPELTIAKTNEMIKEEMPRLVKLAVDKDIEVSLVDISDMVSKEFVAHGPKMIEELFKNTCKLQLLIFI